MDVVSPEVEASEDVDDENVWPRSASRTTTSKVRKREGEVVECVDKNRHGEIFTDRVGEIFLTKVV